MSLTSTLPATARGDASARHYHAGFWLVAAAFVFLAAFGTTPSPLWPLTWQSALQLIRTQPGPSTTPVPSAGSA
jgi:hypothetical protein